MNAVTISGDITNFQGGEGMSGWAVELHEDQHRPTWKWRTADDAPSVQRS